MGSQVLDNLLGGMRREKKQQDGVRGSSAAPEVWHCHQPKQGMWEEKHLWGKITSILDISVMWVEMTASS